MDLSEPSPETQADPADTFEPEPIVIPYAEVIAPLVGQLEDLDVEAVGEGGLRFSGVDGEGRPVSGLMRPRLATGVDGRSIEVSWEVGLTG